MRGTIADPIGFLVASYITTISLVHMIEHFAGNISHPIQAHEGLVAALIAIAATVISSVLVSWSEGLGTSTFRERVMRHVEFAILTAALLNLKFFLWWGDWALQASGRQPAPRRVIHKTPANGHTQP
jgi:phage-related minor tail protein